MSNNNSNVLKVGTQVAYMPDHAKEDFDHLSVQAGFITGESDFDNEVFVRFWLPYKYWEKYQPKSHWADKFLLRIFFHTAIRIHDIREAAAANLGRIPTLRTTANSERVHVRYLRFGTDYVAQKHVDKKLYELGYTDIFRRVL